MKIRIFIIFLACLIIASCEGRKKNPVEGTWKLCELKRKYTNDPNGPFIAEENRKFEDIFWIISNDSITRVHYPVYHQDTKKYFLRNDSLLYSDNTDRYKIIWSADTLILFTNYHTHYFDYYCFTKSQVDLKQVNYLKSNKVDWREMDTVWICDGYGGPDEYADTFISCGYGPHIDLDLRPSNQSNFSYEKGFLKYIYESDTFHFNIFHAELNELIIDHVCAPKCYNLMFYEPDNGKDYYYHKK